MTHKPKKRVVKSKSRNLNTKAFFRRTGALALIPRKGQQEQTTETSCSPKRSCKTVVYDPSNIRYNGITHRAAGCWIPTYILNSTLSPCIDKLVRRLRCWGVIFQGTLPFKPFLVQEPRQFGPDWLASRLDRVGFNADSASGRVLWQPDIRPVGSCKCASDELEVDCHSRRRRMS